MAENLSVEKVGEVLGGLAAAGVSALLSKKGERVVALDVRGHSFVTDFHLLATGRNTPQLKALAGEAARALKEERGKPVRQSGTPESGWEIVDAGDVVVHVFDGEHRDYYRLEELWNDAKRYDIEQGVSENEL